MYSITYIDAEKESLKDSIPGVDYIEIPQEGLPEEMEMVVKVNHENESVLNLGDVVRPGKPGLREYTLELCFPHDGSRRPIFYLNFLRSVIEKGMILRMVIARLDMEGNDIYPTNILVVITEYKVLEKHGAVGDQFVTLKVKEYRTHTTKVVS